MTTDSIQKAIAYAEDHKDTFLEGFKDFLRIQSIGTDPAYDEDVLQAAEFVRAELERIGFENCALMPTAGHPIVYGDWLKAGDDKPTILIYAHYDVQPGDPLDLWETDPFEPTERDGQLLARGANDDKIGIWGNLKVFESFLETSGGLPLNVKVMFEGEEESSSPSLHDFVVSNKDLLHADLLVISDGTHKPGAPENMYSVRGLIALEVIARGPEADFHSGLFGGMVENPTHVIGRIIASLHDEKGNIAVPGAYNGVIPMTESEQTAFSRERQEQWLTNLRGSMGDFKLWGDETYTPVERTTARPSLDINGIYGGYQGEGSKTIIPASAGCKITMRLAPGQDPDEQRDNLIKHIQSFETETVGLEILSGKDGAWPALMLFEGPVIDAFNRACEGLWEQPVKMERVGGTLPLIGMFQQEMGMLITGMNMSVGGRLHSPNEYVVLDSLHTCVATAIKFYTYLGELEEIA